MKIQLEAFHLIDVMGWPVVYDDARGLRAKVWITAPDGHRWLRKQPRRGRPYEPAIEVTALRLATACGLQTATGHAAQWLEDGIAQRGIIVRSFLERPEEEIHAGSEILRGYDASYDVEQRELHTVDRVATALRDLEQRAVGHALVSSLAATLVFDAWVGNADRHPDNWSLISSPDGPMRFSPMYDPAACLGAELSKEHSLLRPDGTGEALTKYIARCPSGFGDGKRLIRMPEVVKAVCGWPEWTALVPIWVRHARELLDHLEAYFATVPEDWLPTERRI